MAVVTKIRTETHACAVVATPRPSMVDRHYDGCSVEAIVATLKEEFGPSLHMVSVWRVHVIQVDGVIYRSSPLNVSNWTKVD